MTRFQWFVKTTGCKNVNKQTFRSSCEHFHQLEDKIPRCKRLHSFFFSSFLNKIIFTQIIGSTKRLYMDHNLKALQRAGRPAHHITRMKLASMEDFCTQRYRKKASRIIRGSNHTGHKLFIRSCTTGLRDSFVPQARGPLNP